MQEALTTDLRTDREETLGLLVSTIREFTRTELVGAEREVEQAGEIPDRILAQLKQMGLFGMTVPVEYGGLGLSMFEEASVVFEVAYASPVFRSYFGTTNGVGTIGLINFGTDEQKAKYLPRIATGECMACFALTEPDAGSDAASLTTRAVRDGDHYVLNGTKRFISNAIHAELVTVFARTGTQEDRAGGISAFLVEAGTPGMTGMPPHQHMGLRGFHQSDIIFEDCRVPASALLGKEGRGFINAMTTLDHARLHMAAVAVGVSERLIDEGLRYAMERKQFGKPISQFQLIQGMLADCRTEAFAARAMVEKASRERDAGVRTTLSAAACKYFATEAAGRIADRVLQIHGGNGYVKDYPIEHLYRAVRVLRIYEGTSQILQLVIAREMIREAS